jgi:hypothetical protein
MAYGVGLFDWEHMGVKMVFWRDLGITPFAWSSMVGCETNSAFREMMEWLT